MYLQVVFLKYREKEDKVELNTIQHYGNEICRPPHS